MSATNVESVGWQLTDASGLSSRGFDNAERDGLGNNVGMLPNFNSSRDENAMTAGQSLTFDDMGMGDCSGNGIFGPCSLRGAAFATDPRLPREIGTTVLPANRDNLWHLTRLAETGQGIWIDRDDPSHWGGVITEFWLYGGPQQHKLVDRDFVDSLRPFLELALDRQSCEDFINKYVGLFRSTPTLIMNR